MVISAQKKRLFFEVKKKPGSASMQHTPLFVRISVIHSRQRTQKREQKQGKNSEEIRVDKNQNKKRAMRHHIDYHSGRK